MSQRSALIAAAIATADVSEPPRPKVVMRPLSALTPWKPEMTATSPLAKPASSATDETLVMRAEAWASDVSIGICQPCQERALMPILLSVSANRPDVTCSPEATTASYSA